jgi:GWxTD domain-containing protein
MLLRRFWSGLSLALMLAVLAGSALTAEAQRGNRQQAPQAEQDPLDRPLTDKQKRENQRRLRQELRDGPYRKWLEEDVRWIISDEERAAFRQLSNDEEREQFIEQFWLRRDPTPDTIENEYREEHFRRIAYANERFAAGIPGWRTDRGRIYIMFGPPDQIDSRPAGGTYDRPAEEGGGTTSVFPFETWRYRYIDGIGQEIEIEFVDRCMCNEYRMTLDRSEKDALLHVPGAGLTLYESMGMASKADRFNNPGLERLGQGPFTGQNQSKQFDRLELFAKLQRPPPVKFKDLEEVVTSKVRYNLMPFEVRADFVRVTSDTVLVPITLQVQNRDVTFVNQDGVARGLVNIFGRVTTMTGRRAHVFEDTVAVDVPEALLERTMTNASIYWKALPLRPGHYRVDIVVKDVNGDRLGTWAQGIRVPRFDEDQLAHSTLILADLMEKVPTRSVGSGSFVLGSSKVRPRMNGNGAEPAFRRDQQANFWMQVYNLGIDEQTQRPSATIEYEVVNAQSNQAVLRTSYSTEEMGNVGDQLTLEKSLALDNLEPGTYQVTIKVNDKISRQTIAPTAKFVVE